MRFTITAAFLALTSSVLAQTPGFDPISKPLKGEQIPAGSTYLIDWEPSSNYTGSVTIDLLGGPDSGGLNPLSVLAKGVDNSVGEYSWAVDKSLGKLTTYGIRITLDSDKTIFQYSFPFAIKASSDSSSSSSTSGGGSGSSSTSSASTTPTGSSTSDSSTTVTTPTTTLAPTGSGNSSTTGSPSKSIVTMTTTASKTSTSSTTVPTNPAVAVVASPMALLGGLALAVFAL